MDPGRGGSNINEGNQCPGGPSKYNSQIRPPTPQEQEIQRRQRTPEAQQKQWNVQTSSHPLAPTHQQQWQRAVDPIPSRNERGEVTWQCPIGTVPQYPLDIWLARNAAYAKHPQTQYQHPSQPAPPLGVLPLPQMQLPFQTTSTNLPPPQQQQQQHTQQQTRTVMPMQTIQQGIPSTSGNSGTVPDDPCCSANQHPLKSHPQSPAGPVAVDAPLLDQSVIQYPGDIRPTFNWEIPRNINRNPEEPQTVTFLPNNRTLAIMHFYNIPEGVDPVQFMHNLHATINCAKQRTIGKECNDETELRKCE